MPSLRCGNCSTNWPIKKDFRECPVCQEKTWRSSGSKAISDEEALSLRLHAEFERFYLKWDETHPPERLIPDDVLCLPTS